MVEPDYPLRMSQSQKPDRIHEQERQEKDGKEIHKGGVCVGARGCRELLKSGRRVATVGCVEFTPTGKRVSDRVDSDEQ